MKVTVIKKKQIRVYMILTLTSILLTIFLTIASKNEHQLTAKNAISDRTHNIMAVG